MTITKKCDILLLTKENKGGNNMGTIKKWFLEKNFSRAEIYVIEEADLGGELYQIEEREKSILFKAVSDFGAITFWCPKSCLTANMTEKELAAQKKFADAIDSGLEYNQKLIDWAKAQGVKGVRKGMKTTTVSKKIKEAGLQVPSREDLNSKEAAEVKEEAAEQEQAQEQQQDVQESVETAETKETQDTTEVAEVKAVNIKYIEGIPLHFRKEFLDRILEKKVCDFSETRSFLIVANNFKKILDSAELCGVLERDLAFLGFETRRLIIGTCTDIYSIESSKHREILDYYKSNPNQIPHWSNRIIEYYKSFNQQFPFGGGLQEAAVETKDIPEQQDIKATTITKKSKFNLQKIMQRAWEIKKEDSRYIFGICLKIAWAEAKTPKIIKKVQKRTIKLKNIKNGFYTDGKDLFSKVNGHPCVWLASRSASDWFLASGTEIAKARYEDLFKDVRPVEPGMTFFDGEVTVLDADTIQGILINPINPKYNSRGYCISHEGYTKKLIKYNSKFNTVS